MEIYVARQPIFDRRQRIYGYELLFRDGMSNAFPKMDGDTATSKLLSNSLSGMGIEQISGGKRAFINFTHDLLIKKVPEMFPRERIVVEILEDVQPEEELVGACRDMVDKGYEIALDDFFYTISWAPLLSISKIVKVDFRAYRLEEVRKNVEKMTTYPVKFLAEKVETHEEFETALRMGFHYFQGYFFSRPQVLTGKDVSPSKINFLHIMAEANKEDFRFDDLEQLIRRDVSISYKLLRYINSAYYRRVREISSIKQAIILLGERGIRRFLSLIAMAKLAPDKPDELIRLSIIRARLCEMLGEISPSRVEESALFTVGLFSLIDAILDDTMENIMDKVPLSEEIKQALTEGTGLLADFLSVACCYEMGDWTGFSETTSKLGINEAKVPVLYMDAVRWADSFSDL